MTETRLVVTLGLPRPLALWALAKHSPGALERVASLAQLGDDYWSQPVPERGWLDLVCRTAEPRKTWTRRDLEDFGRSYFAEPYPCVLRVRGFIHAAAELTKPPNRQDPMIVRRP